MPYTSDQAIATYRFALKWKSTKDEDRKTFLQTLLFNSKHKSLHRACLRLLIEPPISAFGGRLSDTDRRNWDAFILSKSNQVSDRNIALHYFGSRNFEQMKSTFHSALKDAGLKRTAQRYISIHERTK